MKKSIKKCGIIAAALLAWAPVAGTVESVTNNNIVEATTSKKKNKNSYKKSATYKKYNKLAKNASYMYGYFVTKKASKKGPAGTKIAPNDMQVKKIKGHYYYFDYYMDTHDKYKVSDLKYVAYPLNIVDLVKKISNLQGFDYQTGVNTFVAKVNGAKIYDNKTKRVIHTVNAGDKINVCDDGYPSIDDNNKVFAYSDLAYISLDEFEPTKYVSKAPDISNYSPENGQI